jgi:hypothetical protein
MSHLILMLQLLYECQEFQSLKQQVTSQWKLNVI